MIRRLLLIPVLALAQYGASWQSAPGVYLAEFAVGAVVLAAAWLLPRRPPRHAA